MTISKVWKIEGFYVRPTFNDMENVVSEIQWSLTVQQTDNSDSIIGRTMCNGYVALGEPTSDNFISSENLTKEQIVYLAFRGQWSESCMVHILYGIE
jgi:hypothetical protein